MQTAIVNKKEAIGDLFNNSYLRFFIFSVCFLMIFIKVEMLFMILFSIGTPHVLIAVLRDFQKSDLKKTFCISLFINLLLATALFTVSRYWFVYIVYFRFILHFFEDSDFNFKDKNLFLGIGVSFLFYIMDAAAANFTLIASTASLFIAVHLALSWKKKRTLSQTFFSFYFMFFFLSLMPILLRISFNSASWSFNLGIIHSLIWIIYSFHNGEKIKFSPKSSAFMVSAAFLIFNFASVNMDLFTYQAFYQTMFFVFYFLAFLHVFSNDQLFILNKLGVKL